MKKKSLSLLLMASAMLTLVACGNDTSGKENMEDKKEPTVVVETTESVWQEDFDTSGTADSGVDIKEDTIESSQPESQETVVETVTEVATTEIVKLMSPDGLSEIYSFPMPEGYTVISDTSSNYIEIIDDDNEFIKIEIFSGLNKDVLSANSIDALLPELYAEKVGCKVEDLTDNTAYKAYAGHMKSTSFNPVNHEYDMHVAYIDHHIYQRGSYEEYYVGCVCHAGPARGEVLSTEYLENPEEFNYRIFEYYTIDEDRKLPPEESWTVRITIYDDYFAPDDNRKNNINECAEQVHTVVSLF